MIRSSPASLVTPDVPRREVDVAGWLAAAGLPAVRLADEVDQLRVIDGRVVTWWDLIVESRQKPTFTDLAVMLRRLHDLPDPTTFDLPLFDPMPRVLGRLEAAGEALAESDRKFIATRHSELRATYEAMSFDLDPGPDPRRRAPRQPHAPGGRHRRAHRPRSLRVGPARVGLVRLRCRLCGLRSRGRRLRRRPAASSPRRGPIPTGAP